MATPTEANRAAPPVRPVAAVVPAMHTIEGDGFEVRRPFPTPTLDAVDPFLLLDHMGPATFGPGEAKGTPEHPHRGFETVTYIIDGELEHRDSLGNLGRIEPGGVQWMTAGAGVVHTEKPSRAILRDGGSLHGVQLWVNLPRRAKMTPPRYQEVRAADIPEVRTDGATVRVVAGEAFGVHGPAATHVPILYAHVTLHAGSSLDMPTPAGSAAIAYVLGGHGRFGPDGRAAGEGTLVRFADGDGAVRLAADASAPSAPSAPLDALVLAGVPLREPVVRYGPFVMNTKAEIAAAVDDYQSGRMGRIAPRR